MTARERMLQRIRAALGNRPAPASPPAAAPPATLPIADRAARFAERLRAVAGECAIAADLADAARQIAGRLDAAAARSVALGDGDDARAVGAELAAAGFSVLPSDAPTAALFAAEAGLTEAQWAIAETGSLVLDAAAARARRASLLPPLHVALLRADRLLGDLDAAIAAVTGSGQPSHAITFVTGPSRTADIELQLVVGVHGPAALFVVLLPAR